MKPPTCIDLKARFGREYRVRYEESYYAEYGPNALTRDPWYMIIPGKYGHVYPHGGELLGAATDKAGIIARKLRKLPGVRVSQDGDDGINALFSVALIPQVADLLKLRRRRLSPEQRAILADRARAMSRQRQGSTSSSAGQAVATRGDTLPA
jgi:hypothetical protein